MKKFIICILIIISMGNLYAADKVKKNISENKTAKKKDKETSSDKKIESSDLTIVFLCSMPNLQMGMNYFEKQVNGSTRETDEIKYVPNVNLSWGADISYGDYGFSYSMEIPDSGKDEKIYGKSDYTDFQLYYYGEKYGADIFYQKYSGFYMENAGSFGYADNDAVFRRADMSMSSAGFNIYYSFNDAFSLNKAFKVTRNSIKDGGSFLIMVSPNYFGVNSSRSLVLPNQESLYGSYSGFYKGEYYSIALSPGYAYSLSSGNGFCFTFSIFGGLGVMYKDYSISSQHVTDTGASIKANVKFLLGYNSDSFFCGIEGLGDGTSAKDPFADTGLSIMSYVMSVEIFCGIRI